VLYAAVHHPPSLGGMRQFPSVPLAVPAELDITAQPSSRRREPPSSFPTLAGKNCNELESSSRRRDPPSGFPALVTQD